MVSHLEVCLTENLRPPIILEKLLKFLSVNDGNNLYLHTGSQRTPVGSNRAYMYVRISVSMSLFLFVHAFVRPVIECSTCGLKPRFQIPKGKYNMTLCWYIPRSFANFVFVFIYSVGVQHWGGFIFKYDKKKRFTLFWPTYQSNTSLMEQILSVQSLIKVLRKLTGMMHGIYCTEMWNFYFSYPWYCLWSIVLFVLMLYIHFWNYYVPHTLMREKLP